MASSPEYLEYVLDLLPDVPEVSTRKMMGECLLYASGKLLGGVYDDRFLVKDTPASRAVLSSYETPYEGASPMLLVDTEDASAIAAPVAQMLLGCLNPRSATSSPMWTRMGHLPRFAASGILLPASKAATRMRSDSVCPASQPSVTPCAATRDNVATQRGGWYKKHMKGGKLVALTVYYKTPEPSKTGYYLAKYRVH